MSEFWTAILIIAIGFIILNIITDAHWSRQFKLQDKKFDQIAKDRYEYWRDKKR